MIDLFKISETGDEPLTLVRAKSWLRKDGAEEDDDIMDLCFAARVSAEKYTSRSLMASAQYKYRFSSKDICGQEFHAPFARQSDLLGSSHRRVVTLPRGPLVSVQSVSVDGVVVDTANYESVAGDSKLLPQIRFFAWLSTGKVVEIVFTVGTDKPSPTTVLAMKFMVAHWFSNRESQEMPDGAMVLLDQDRLIG